MKRLLYILPILLFAAVSCSKEPSLSDNPISIEITSLQPRNVWFDIIPENNDFYYYFDVVSLEEYNKYPSDAAFIRDQDDFLRMVYESLLDLDEIGSFQETLLYRDAIFEPYYGNGVLLEPEHDYVVFAFPYDSKGQPIEKIVKQRFTTPAEKHSDITFEVALEGSLVTVTPSNSDQYLYEYEFVDVIDDSYLGYPSIYYSQMVSVYEEYGFMDTMVSRGEETEDMMDYIDLEPGDEVYFGIAGYDNGLTTEVSFYKLTYTGPGLPGIVEPYFEDSEDFVAGQGLMGVYMSCRSRKR